MNKIFLIGNLTNDPVSKTTQSGIQLCTFTIAVNRKHSANAQQETDFFRVTAWRQLADICAKYLAKGKKVSVVGSVSASAYQSNSGDLRASLDVQAEDVEFLSPAEKTQQNARQSAPKQNDGEFVKVDDELPF